MIVTLRGLGALSSAEAFVVGGLGRRKKRVRRADSIVLLCKCQLSMSKELKPAANSDVT